MSVEIKIVADSAANLISKMAEVAKSMSSGGAEPVTVSTMLDAINTQLPKGMECVITDHNAEEDIPAEVDIPAQAEKQAPTKKRAPAKKPAPAEKPVPAEKIAEEEGQDDET